MSSVYNFSLKTNTFFLWYPNSTVICLYVIVNILIYSYYCYDYCSNFTSTLYIDNLRKIALSGDSRDRDVLIIHINALLVSGCDSRDERDAKYIFYQHSETSWFACAGYFILNCDFSLNYNRHISHCVQQNGPDEFLSTLLFYRDINIVEICIM